MPPGSYLCKHGRSFDPANESCPDCDAEPAGTEPIVLGDGELLCAEAERRGLPNGFDVEERVVGEWETARARSLKCAAYADTLISMSSDDAIRWEMAAAKWADTAIKAAKIVAGTVQVRERIAAADRADREHARQERSH